MENTEFNLWHYTTLEGLKGILSDKTIWATDYQYLSDSSEFIYSKSIIHQEVLPKIISTIEYECKGNPAAKKIVDAYNGIENLAGIETDETIKILIISLLSSPTLPQIPFVLSFCKVLENSSFLQRNGLLSQWRGYGEDGGYAIIFDFKKIIDEFKVEENSFYHGISTHDDVVYETDKSKMSDKMKKYLDKVSDHTHKIYRFRLYGGQFPLVDQEELNSLFNCMVLLKHEGFKEENEYRFCTMSYCKEAQKNKYFEIDKNKSFKETMTRNNNGTLIPYSRLFERSNNLPIKGVCVGPHRDKALRVKSIKTYLSSIGLANIKVFCSEIPYIGLK